MAGVFDNLFPFLRLRRNVPAGGQNQQQQQQRNQQQQQQQQPNQQRQPPAANPNAEQQFATIRDRLFHTIFVRLSLGYARAFTPRARRIIEFASVVMALSSLAMLSYIHVAFAHVPTHCLDHVKDTWPRDGILRVEIIRNPGADYTLAKSYEKEERLKLRDPETLILTTLEQLLDGEKHKRQNPDGAAEAAATQAPDSALVATDGTTDSAGGSSGPADPTNSAANLTATRDVAEEAAADAAADVAAGGETQPTHGEVTSDSPQSPVDTDSMSADPNVTSRDLNPAPVTEGNSSDHAGVPPSDSDAGDYSPLSHDVTSLERFFKTAWPENDYIVEFSLEYGLLRLLPATRRRLRVPTRIVLLDPDRDACFGDFLSRQILARLIGYDDILISSVKELSEAQDNRGFLRNVVTGEVYRFVSNWPTSTSVFNAGFIMFCFTLTVSMLLRYSHQQIFIFIVDLLQMLEANTVAHFPAAPLLTVILALVGMEAVMSEFFNDTTTAFYVIFTVWMVDQYDAVCCHTAVSRKHFLRFFFLYHYCFYAYHYRFNGQYSGLALVTSWLFIQHAMLYFFHHYELPVILRNARIQQLVTNAIRRDNLRRAGGAPQPGPTPEQVLLAMMDAPTPPPPAAATDRQPRHSTARTPATGAAGLSAGAETPVASAEASNANSAAPSTGVPGQDSSSEPPAASVSLQGSSVTTSTTPTPAVSEARAGTWTATDAREYVTGTEPAVLAEGPAGSGVDATAAPFAQASDQADSGTSSHWEEPAVRTSRGVDTVEGSASGIWSAQEPHTEVVGQDDIVRRLTVSGSVGVEVSGGTVKLTQTASTSTPESGEVSVAKQVGEPSVNPVSPVRESGSVADSSEAPAVVSAQAPAMTEGASVITNASESEHSASGRSRPVCLGGDSLATVSPSSEVDAKGDEPQGGSA